MQSLKILALKNLLEKKKKQNRPPLHPKEQMFPRQQEKYPETASD